MKHIFYKLALVILLLILTIVSVGCKPSIVGKWSHSESGTILEFTRDSNVIIDANGFIFTGTYEIIGDDVVKLNLEGWGALINIFGADTWKYEISGNTMTVTGAGQTSTFKRTR